MCLPLLSYRSYPTLTLPSLHLHLIQCFLFLSSTTLTLTGMFSVGIASTMARCYTAVERFAVILERDQQQPKSAPTTTSNNKNGSNSTISSTPSPFKKAVAKFKQNWKFELYLQLRTQVSTIIHTSSIYRFNTSFSIHPSINPSSNLLFNLVNHSYSSFLSPPSLDRLEAFSNPPLLSLSLSLLSLYLSQEITGRLDVACQLVNEHGLVTKVADALYSSKDSTSSSSSSGGGDSTGGAGSSIMSGGTLTHQDMATVRAQALPSRLKVNLPITEAFMIELMTCLHPSVALSSVSSQVRDISCCI